MKNDKCKMFDKNRKALDIEPMSRTCKARNLKEHMKNKGTLAYQE